MGKIRARTEDELAARKNEILKAAEELLMKESYAAITLATIAEKTSISRTSMYTYYETKEQVMVDLMIREYQAMAGELLSSRTKRMNREAFCAWLSELLWNHQTLLKLLSLQLPVWDRNYSDEMLEYFVQCSASYMRALDSVLAFHFPNTDEREKIIFKIQFSIYCNALYETRNLPYSQMKAMEEHAYFSTIPEPQIICRDGLMLLSAVLESHT